MKLRANQKRQNDWDTGITRILEGKRITKAQARALAVYAVIDFGSFPGQVCATSFPAGYYYLGGLDVQLLIDDRSRTSEGLKLEKNDLENHKRFVEAANQFFWELRDRYFPQY